MFEFSQIIFDASFQRYSTATCSMISKSDVDDYVLIHIPTSIAKFLTLENIYDITNDAEVEINKDTCERDGFRPWYKIASSCLDFSIGFHEYRMKFKNCRLKGQFNMFFKYQVYDDKLDKSYIYMENHEKE